VRVLILGAGFGGLELATRLSDEFGDDLDVVLVDQSDGFVFGFSKLDVMFGRALPSAVRHSYRDYVKPGVQVVRSTVRLARRDGTSTRRRDELFRAVASSVESAAQLVTDLVRQGHCGTRRHTPRAGRPSSDRRRLTMGRLITLTALAGAAAMVVALLPDIKRYLKMRAM
jgi:hypothetical protein